MNACGFDGGAASRRRITPPAGVVRYVEARGDGRYEIDEEALRRVVRERQGAGDEPSLDCLVEELFRCSNQGRRPWSLAGERSLLGLARAGLDLLRQVRQRRPLLAKTYDAIDPSWVASAILGERARLERLLFVGNDVRHVDLARWRATLGVFDEILAIYAQVFDAWASDHPESAKSLPPEILNRADRAPSSSTYASGESRERLPSTSP